MILSFNIAHATIDGIEITGEQTVIIQNHSVKLQCKSSLDKSCLQKKSKKIKLQTLKFDRKFKADFKKKLTEILPADKQSITANTSVELHNLLRKNHIKMQVDLGMDNMPVLDQGPYGTCITFSTTAALNALKHIGDTISQQCLLELGNFEEEMSFGEIASGWDGAYYEEVISRIQNYGIVTKSKCPHQYANSTYKLFPHEYMSYSRNGRWARDVNFYDLSNRDQDYRRVPATIEQIKSALNSGHRILIGAILLNDYPDGLPIKNSHNGLWDFPPNYSMQQVEQDIEEGNFGGHAIIVTGYNEDLKLFKIRNSWGPTEGDHGDFYMTYRYFERMNDDAFEVF